MSLFARVYAFGLGIAGSWALVLAAAMAWVIVPAQDADSAQGIRWASRQLLRLRHDPAGLAEAAASLRSDAGIELTLYGPAGEVVVSNVDPPLPRAPAGDEWVVPIDGGVVAVGRDLEPIDLTIGLRSVALALAALALVAWPLARSVTRPLARLGDAVERFGAGELGARAGRSSGDEVGQLAARFDQMAERIVALLDDERLWMAGLSHEFRTPLHRLRLALDNAEDADGQLSPAEVAAIRDDVAELDELVADVLAAARLLAAPGALHRREVLDLAGVVRAACARAGVPPPQGSEVWVEGDRRLLTRALLNLLRNA
ncbi:MAG: HAMP domain-containing protein, partial [Myxococcota bacterium]